MKTHILILHKGLARQIPCLFFTLVSLFYFSYGQIVNTEALRKEQGARSWTLDTKIFGNISKEEELIAHLGAKVNLYVNLRVNTLMFLNNFKMSIADKKNLVNNGFTHFRYNYTGINRYFVPEFFVQAQYNQIKKMIFRGLVGTGPRSSIIKHKYVDFNVGLVYMFEYDQIDDDILHYLEHRFSTYLSLMLKSKERFSFKTVVYYQPNILLFI